MSDKSPYKTRGVHRPAGIPPKARPVAPWWCFGQTVGHVEREMIEHAAGTKKRTFMPRPASIK